jgi:hypothetical protein
MSSKHTARSVVGRSEVLAFAGVFAAHGALQWLAWAGHPGHTVNGVILPWWPTVWTIVTEPAAWVTGMDVASHWALIMANAVLWATVGAMIARVARLALRRAE